MGMGTAHGERTATAPHAGSALVASTAPRSGSRVSGVARYLHM